MATYRLPAGGLVLAVLLHAAALWWVHAVGSMTSPRPQPTVSIEVIAAPPPAPIERPRPQPSPPKPRSSAVPPLSRPVPLMAAETAARPDTVPTVVPSAPVAPDAEALPAPPMLQQAAPAPPAPSPSAPRFDADYLHNPRPPYPPLSRRLGEEGRVVLKVQVAADGLPIDVQLHTSSGFERLDRVALETVRRWRFVPARSGDQPVAASVLVPMVFSLKD